MFWALDHQTANQLPLEEMGVCNGSEHTAHIQFIPLLSNPAQGTWITIRKGRSSISSSLSQRPDLLKPSKNGQSFSQHTFSLSDNLANALGRLPVQRWWGIPSRWHKNTPTSQGKKFSLFSLSLPNFKHQSKLLLFPVPKSQALKRASSKPLFLCLSFNSNQQHGICQRVSYMYTLFIVFSGVLSFPKLCTPLENKDEYKSLIRSMAEVL